MVSAGIPFRIIPGITSGIGGLAYAGIPLTHRDTNQSVTLVTGHDASGNVSQIDWKAISDGSPVIVIYMAMKHIERIVQELRNAGRPANEPIAFVCNASMPNQTVIETLVYTGESITRVFFIAAGMFAGTSLYGYTTKKDLTGMGSFLFMGLIGILIASVLEQHNLNALKDIVERLAEAQDRGLWRPSRNSIVDQLAYC